MRNTMEIEGYRAVIQFDPDIEMFRSFLRYQLTAYPFADRHLHSRRRRASIARRDPTIAGFSRGRTSAFHGRSARALQSLRWSQKGCSTRILASESRKASPICTATRNAQSGRFPQTGDPRLHRHRVRQDRVLPLPRHQPKPRAPGRGCTARHQRRHRLSDERAFGQLPGVHADPFDWDGRRAMPR